MHRSTILLLLFLTLSCGSPAETTGESLDGKPVSVETSGPWTVRRAVNPATEEHLADDAVAWGGDTASGASPEPTSSEAPRRSVGKLEVAAKSKATPDSGSRPPAGDRQAGPLRAGSTDDNAHFDKFVKFLASWSDRKGVAGQFEMLDVSERRHIRVVDEKGRPLPGAEVRIVDEAADRVLLEGTTYGDGRVPWYPRLAEGGVPEKGVLVEVRSGGESMRTPWAGDTDELIVNLGEVPPPPATVSLDVLFLIDTTGSMGDEIASIKQSLLGMTKKLRSLEREFDLRYGAVLYRDVGDEYLTKLHPFTGDIEAFDTALKAVRADGGGDNPESLNQGLAEAVNTSKWRAGAAKVVFLIADAPPHMDYQGDVTYGTSVVNAVAKGIRIHTVAASGLRELGSMIFRQIAQFTRGKFIFIEYGTVEKSAAAHGVEAKVKANNLDDILFEQIREEVATFGRE